MLEPEKIKESALVLRNLLLSYGNDPVANNCLRTLESLLARAVQGHILVAVFRVPCKYEFVELFGNYKDLKDAFFEFVYYAEDGSADMNPRIRSNG